MSTVDWLPAGFSVQRIDTNDTRLSVAVGGSGPVLVLLHGWPQTSRAWARVMPDLAQNHTVGVPDLRGTGNSDRPKGGYAKTNQADDIRGILTALNLTGLVAVAGHDIGSMVAFAFSPSALPTPAPPPRRPWPLTRTTCRARSP
ncbi:alpha/beta fold hydrolase [Streptomyces sp. NPDC005423]|uniref:alpha/beta fold hydrolase n=1 Tax=Streptomyces sp. NPDC005423 TaxID=3155343 RepID=UPI0033B7D2B2